VEGDTEFACSQVVTAERLLHQMLASVSQNLLYAIQVSLKKERNACLCASGLLRGPSFPPIFAYVALVSR
jgi:hypothetical protein